MVAFGPGSERSSATGTDLRLGSPRAAGSEQNQDITTAPASPAGEFVSRPYTFPQPGDTLQSVADRVLPDEAGNRDTLLGWNPHLALRAATMDAPGGMLPTDLVYTAPPA